MLTEDDINHQRDLLATYRNNVKHLLTQVAQFGGESGAPLSVVNSLREQRTHIQHIKEILQTSSVFIEDHPDDTPRSIAQAINPKDRRVAVKFESALNSFVGSTAVFLTSNGFEEGMKIILEDHADVEGSNYPLPNVVDEVISVFVHTTLKSSSYAQIGEKQLTWAETFVLNLIELAQECDRILNQYAERDESLIALVDEIHDRAENLAFMISTSVNMPQLSHLYDNGIPDIHVDWFRYFFLTILKSYRVIREFKVS